MKKFLILFEWPWKFKTVLKYKNKIEKLLEKYFWKSKVELWATFWHFLSSDPKSLWIEIKKEWKKYKFLYEKWLKLSWDKKIRDNVKKLKKLIDEVLKSWWKIIIATDKDREWEAIAREIVYYFKLKDSDYIRLPLVSIEEKDFLSDLEKSIKNNEKINEKLYKAWYARAVLDKLFWYVWSPVFKRDIVFKLDKKFIDKVLEDLKSKIEKFKKENKDKLNDERVKKFIKKVEKIIKEIENYKKDKKELFVSSIWRVQIPMLILIVDEWMKNFDKIEAKNYIKIKDEKDKTWNLADEIENYKKVYNEIKNEKYIKILSIEKKKKKISQPKPFNETSVMNMMNQLYWYSPKEIMQFWQKMYEQWLVSYFRSKSTGYTEGSKKFIKWLIEKAWLKNLYVNKDYKIDDETWHDAIHTVFKWKIIYDWKYYVPQWYNLTECEKRYFDLVYRRTLAWFLKEVEYENYKIIGKVKEYKFELEINILINEWFYKIYPFVNTNFSDYWLVNFYKKNKNIKIKKVILEEWKFKFTDYITFTNFKNTLQKKKNISTPSTFTPIFEIITKSKKYVKYDWKNKIEPETKWIVLYYFLKELKDKYKVVNIDYTDKMEWMLNKIISWKISDSEFLNMVFLNDFKDNNLYDEYLEVLEYFKNKWWNNKKKRSKSKKRKK